MPTILETVQQAVALCRGQGIKPNRLRLAPATRIKLCRELGLRDSLILKGRALQTLDDLLVEVWYTCPPDNIYVDRKPEDEELGELEERLRAKFGYPYGT